MSDRAVPGAWRSGRFRDVVSGVVVVLGIWLGWQVTRQFISVRMPASMAVQVAPDSADTLARAADAELSAGRNEAALELAEMALARAPFDVRALRIIGLVNARAGRTEEADQLLTLAGNWSLRDSPSHGWLVERRLRQGSYASAFAHADTLARRQINMQPAVFRLFKSAAALDARAVPPLADRLGENPPWREKFVTDLYMSGGQNLAIASNLAVMLESSQAPFTDVELGELYRVLFIAGQVQMVKEIRNRLDRPPLKLRLIDGAFSEPSPIKSFGWSLSSAPGLTAEVIDRTSGNAALHVAHRNLSLAPVARQLLLLGPGRYRLDGQILSDDVNVSGRMSWSVRCLNNVDLGTVSPKITAADRWHRFSAEFEVSEDCPAQQLLLIPTAGDRTRMTDVWFDNMSISGQS